MDCRFCSQNIVLQLQFQGSFPSMSWTSVVRLYFKMDATSTDYMNWPGSVVRSGQINGVKKE
jgi:hypothetical protein